MSHARYRTRIRTLGALLAASFLFLGAAGCSKVELKNTRISRSAVGIAGRPAQSISAGGGLTDRKQTSVGLSSKGGVFTSPSYRAVIGVQGSLYAQ